VRDLQVIVLDRPRHYDLIEEIRSAGARVLLRADGDTAGALIAATPQAGADVLMGVGGVPEGVTAACAVKALGGGMLGCLSPQSDEEREAIDAAGLSTTQILTCNELVIRFFLRLPASPMGLFSPAFNTTVMKPKPIRWSCVAKPAAAALFIQNTATWIRCLASKDDYQLDEY
jgi:hypothetical protein